MTSTDARVKKRRCCGWWSLDCFRAVANKICPRDVRFEERVEAHKHIGLRLERIAIFFMMIWTIFQLVLFIGLFIAFIYSDNNLFMTTSDCCMATSYIYDVNNLPLEACSNKQCPLYNYVFPGTLDLTQQRPRQPSDGDFSFMFTHDGRQHCCNLAPSGDECCNKIPYSIYCGLVMWCSGFSAVCAMLMTQVILQAMYSFTARKHAWSVPLFTILAGVFRVFIFFFIFYLFFAFLFLFIFFWVAMYNCDNPYAFNWYLFGFDYVYYFFDNAQWIWTQGVTSWDGNMDIDSLIAGHTVGALGIDFVFGLLYFLLHQIKDDHRFPYFHLAYFHL